jgi:threonine/homoserine/homoserine lactone efflux protein
MLLQAPADALLFGQSLLIGLSIAAPVGPIGVLVIQRTLQQGRAAGLATGLGAALADAVYGAIGAFSVSWLVERLLALRTGLVLAGGAYLLWLAWRIATQPPAGSARGTARAPAGTLLRHAAGTFVLTLSNPATILSFMAVFGALAGGLRPGSAATGSPTVAAPWLMVAGVGLGSALWWLALTGGIQALRSRFGDGWQLGVNRASAAVLAGIAVWQGVSLLG